MTVDHATLTEVTRSIWTTMLDEEPQPSPGALTLPCENRITAYVHITGEWMGTVVLDGSLTMAKNAAAKMLGLPPSEVQAEDMRDALGELANMLGGNVKSLVPGPSFLSLPSVTTGQDYEVLISPTKKICQATFEHASEPFEVALLEHDPSAVHLHPVKRHGSESIVPCKY